jgi:hypothetical protein
MTAVVASREYVLQKNGERATIAVQIGTPALRPNEEWVWYCPFTVQQDGKTQQLAADGADSLQALTLALSALDAILEYRRRGGRLIMPDGTEGVGISRRPTDGPTGQSDR